MSETENSTLLQSLLEQNPEQVQEWLESTPNSLHCQVELDKLASYT